MKTLIRKLGFLVIIVSIFSLILSCSDESGNNNTALPSVPYYMTDWMRDIDDNKSIADITIPGTHDTGADLPTSQQGIMANEVICQDYFLSNQLEMGVRWFDIRLRLLDNGDLAVHHWKYYLHKNFDDMLKPALDFLKDHPTETVIFMIKQEDSEYPDLSFSIVIHNKLSEYGLDKFYLEQESLPKMKDVRGKMVIVRRFDSRGLPFNLGYYMAWSDNTKGEMYRHNSYMYIVQDHYKLVTVSYEEKLAEIEKLIMVATLPEFEGTLFLNFTSGEKETVNLRKIASNINPWVDDFVKRYSGLGKAGVIFVNFAGSENTSDYDLVPHLVKHIIQVNDFQSSVLE